MLKFLKGDKSSSDISGCRDFFRSLKGYLAGADVCVFDLEVGGCVKEGGRYGIRLGQEALHSHTGEILLAGWMGAGVSNYELITGDGNERGIARRLVGLLDDVHSRGGAIFGHNIMGYDIPMLVDRCRLLNVAFPGWLAAAASKRQRGRMIESRVGDSLYFYNPFSRFPQQGMSLADTSGFWGRTFESFGARFGEIWRTQNEMDRNNLRIYNLWNLLDSLSLLAFSGAADVFRVSSGQFETEPQVPSAPWVNDGRFAPRPIPGRLGGRASKQQDHVFAWLTAPLPGLYENGPSSTKNWGRITTEAAKFEYPYAAGRQNPQAVRIVGYVTATPLGRSVHLNPNNEIVAIEHGLTWLRQVKGERVWVDDLAAFRALTIYRGSLYNAITPSWVAFGGDSQLRDIKSLEASGAEAYWTLSNLAQSSGLVADGQTVSHPPLFCGQADSDVQAAAELWLDAVATLSTGNQG